MINNNFEEFGWEKIKTPEGDIIIRIPETNDRKKLFFRPKELRVDCLGIPKTFKDAIEFQYLVKDIKTLIAEVWVLDKKISDLVKNCDYAEYTTKAGHTSYEVKNSLWKIYPFNEKTFPKLTKVWINKRLQDYKDFFKQLKLL